MDKTLLYKLSYGLYVVGSTKEGSLNGQIADTVFQISEDPCIVAISINRNNLTNEFIKNSKVFSVSVLPKSAALNFIGHFGFKSGRDIAKYQTVSFKQGVTGAPVLLEQTIGYLEAEVINAIEAGTHTLFIGKVVNAEVFSDEAPMTYDYYRQVKSGTVANEASTYIKDENKAVGKKRISNMKKYRCTVCGYVYDPDNGHPDASIAPGTAFEDIPDSWVCPICGVSKDQFEAVE